MAHVILLTDRSPESSYFDSIGWSDKTYTLPAGAYKLASHLREQGFSVLVVPNCLGFTLQGIQQIIQNNSQRLLWVGISTTFLTVKSPTIEDYRHNWSSDPLLILKEKEVNGNNVSFFQTAKQLAWGNSELNLISDWLKQQFNVPLIIGGAWVTTIKHGNLRGLNDNCYIVPGRSELYVERFTKQKLANPDAIPECVNDNSHYDNNLYRYSQMHWRDCDLITADDWLPLEISRGCAFDCAYCDYDRKGTFDNYKDPKTLLQELIRNYEKYGVTRYNLLDDLYNDSKEKVRELYDKVWSRLPFTPEWTSYLRLDMLWSDPDSAEIIKASGAKIASFGIETLHDRAGRKVGKGLGKRRILETLTMLKEKWGTDTLVSGLFIIGLPYEPEESILETIEWASQTDLLYTFNFAPLWVTPPTQFDIVTKFNKISLHNDTYGVTWLSPDNWINSEGITFAQADHLAQLANSNRLVKIQSGHGHYPDLRVAGLTHDEIVRLKTDASLVDRLYASKQIRNSKIETRLNQVLNLRGV